MEVVVGVKDIVDFVVTHDDEVYRNLMEIASCDDRKVYVTLSTDASDVVFEVSDFDQTIFNESVRFNSLSDALNLEEEYQNILDKYIYPLCDFSESDRGEECEEDDSGNFCSMIDALDILAGTYANSPTFSSRNYFGQDEVYEIVKEIELVLEDHGVYKGMLSI